MAPRISPRPPSNGTSLRNRKSKRHNDLWSQPSSARPLPRCPDKDVQVIALHSSYKGEALQTMRTM